MSQKMFTNFETPFPESIEIDSIDRIRDRPRKFKALAKSVCELYDCSTTGFACSDKAIGAPRLGSASESRAGSFLTIVQGRIRLALLMFFQRRQFLEESVEVCIAEGDCLTAALPIQPLHVVRI